ncbi:MAG: hypothetical protein FWD59_05010 [Micrococcales bacterium]|nr:hypothetical protein [Micrococcales bacterium]
MMASNAMAAYRSCRGVVSLAERHNPEIVERACQIALAAGDARYHTIKALTESGANPPNPRPDGDMGTGALLRGPAAFTIAN